MATVNGEDIVKLASQSMGVKYVWGGTDLQNGMDCSGLVQSVYAKFGISVPRVTYNQINTGAAVGRGELRPGDLVFFDTDRSQEGPDHVGIYMGGGKFIHAPKTGDVVKVSSLADSYYADRYMAGRRMANVAVPGQDTESPVSVDQAAGSEARRPAATRLAGDELAQRYGLSYAFFQSEPELMKLLEDAVGGQWDTAKWGAMLENTKWWKNNSETMRQAVQMEKSDPATFKAQMEAASFSLRQQATQMGAVINDTQLNTLARNVIALGWQEAQIQDYLGKYIDFTDTKVLGGQAQAHYQEIHRTAYRNGITLDDQSIRNYAAYIGRGISTMEQTLGYIRQQAAGAFPAYAEQIMAGQDVQDIAAPYMQSMAREFEMPQEALDPFTPEIRSALNRRDAQGAPSPVSLSDFQAQLRGDARWRRTDAAFNNTLGVGRQVLRDFGLLGGAL